MDTFDEVEFVKNLDPGKLVGARITKDQWKYIARTFKIGYSHADSKKELRQSVLSSLVSTNMLPEYVLNLECLTASSLESLSLDQGAGDVSTGVRTTFEGGLPTPHTGMDEMYPNVPTHTQNTGKNELVHDDEDNNSHKSDSSIMSLKEQELILRGREVRVKEEQLRWEREQLYLNQKAELDRLARIEREAELDRQKDEREKEKAERERERLQLELQLAQINQSRNLSGNRSSTNSHYFDVSKSSQLLSKFDENDPEAFFEMFEKLANQLEWDKKYWTILIQTKLFGKARTVYNNLNEAEAKDYDTVKKVILLSYDQVTETYRQRFRNTHKSQGMTYMEFVDVLERLFDKWIKSAETSDFASLRQLMILDQFKFRVPTDIRAYLEEKEVTDLIQAAKLADNYSLTHRKSGNVKAFSGSQTSCNSQDSRKFAPKIQNEQFQSGFKHPNSSTVIYCSYCKQKGHHISECYHKDCQKSKYYQPNKNTQNKSQKNPIQIANVDSQKPSTNKQDKTPPQNIQGKEKPSLSVDIESVPRVGDLFDEFTFSGRISTGPNEDFSNVSILRDTGSAQSILVRSALPNIEKAYTGEKVIVKDLSGSGPMPLANVYIDSDLIKGFARVGVIEKPLPVKGISFLLGNDLAGTLIVPCPVVTSEPVVESCDNELYPVCAVTRAQSKAVDPLDCPDNGLAELFSREEVQNYISMPITRDNLIKAQNQDPSLCEALSSAVDNVHLLKGTGYYMENGLLLRQYRPSHISNKDDWAIVKQIVVPADFRESIVELAHGKFAGHLGINKTSDKLLKHFYWPDLRKTVSKFVKSCHICQIGGKPNQVIPKAPLQPIPVTEEPFNKVIIDCVGPLPKTKKGNQYLLTIMCSVTRYPEAIALKSLRSQVIVKALLKVFTQYGVPQIIQSDRGSNFTASLFSDVMKGLGIAQYFSSAYHPESQGALERFHQTFKTMLRMFCLENEKDWDEGIDLLLFSIRDAKNASLGFSPFQLLLDVRSEVL